MEFCEDDFFCAPMINFSTLFNHKAAMATGLAFFTTGVIFGTWAALIPYVKLKFDLDEAQLGLLLLCLPAGVTLMNPFSVPLLNRYGAVRTNIWSLRLAAMLFVLPITMPVIWQVAFSLFLAGAAFSCANVAMNTCASLLEQRENLRIFSTCHGLWSAGAMIGSALAGMATGWGVTPILYVCMMMLVHLSVTTWLQKPLRGIPDDPQPATSPAEKPSGFIFPNKALWTLILISLCTNLTEGTMSDWSAVYMREIVGSGEALAGWGFATYAFFMAGGRFLGDELIARYGSKLVLRLGGCVVALGLLLSVVLQTNVGVLTGFALVGAGVSLGAPILYAASTRVPDMAKGAGLATMNTFAMASFMGGPALIGFIAKFSSLPTAFLLVALFAGLWVWKAGKIS